jgi:hypothetical protein
MGRSGAKAAVEKPARNIVRRKTGLRAEEQRHVKKGVAEATPVERA